MTHIWIYLIWGYKVLLLSFTLQNIWRIFRFPSLDMKDLLWPIIFIKIAQFLRLYKSITIKFWKEFSFHLKVLTVVMHFGNFCKKLICPIISRLKAILHPPSYRKISHIIKFDPSVGNHNLNESKIVHNISASRVALSIVMWKGNPYC